jgi:hypothetical protein
MSHVPDLRSRPLAIHKAGGAGRGVGAEEVLAANLGVRVPVGAAGRGGRAVVQTVVQTAGGLQGIVLFQHPGACHSRRWRDLLDEMSVDHAKVDQ